MSNISKRIQNLDWGFICCVGIPFTGCFILIVVAAIGLSVDLAAVSARQ